MVFISEELVRKRAEHNNCEITSLEELSLHQLDIERIEHLDKWCKDLKILYLQSNLIPRIENVRNLKKLEYLNLALNNIKKVENLEACESLQKLDLTVNFVSELTSIEKLRNNRGLKELFLTGNPCTDFIGYRDYVVATLPSLLYLDGREIEKSERILAMQKYAKVHDDILRQQTEYQEKEKKRKIQRENKHADGRWYTDIDDSHQSETTSFWEQPSEYTPESRIELYKQMEEEKAKKESATNNRFDPSQAPREVRLFNSEGRPYNINQAKLNFRLTEDPAGDAFLLDVPCYKHMETSQIDVDIQPWYIRVTLKGKILQLVFCEEVCPDQSSAKRSQTSGHLLITIPKLQQIISKPDSTHSAKSKKIQPENKTKLNVAGCEDLKTTGNACWDGRQNIKSKNAIVEQDMSLEKTTQLLSVSDSYGCISCKCDTRGEELEDFIDDPNVPPLL